ncbi:Cloroperoxidase [Xylariaceae sp. AK1471]|nr:Cloroperoxidase [Xylariaceae sp. AK1471]
MQFPLFTPSLILRLASAQMSGSSSNHHGWVPAGPEDFRGPCPMMNTLANHGFLQRDGRNITRENAIKALSDGLNFDASLATIMFDQAIIANPEPNASYFTLEQLNRHNVLEHDASLSRSDAYFGNNHVFNQTVFDETRKYWVEPILTANMLANSKIARQVSSKAFNPTYTFTSITEEFSLGEVAAPVIAFGDMNTITVNKSLVEYFFENERLPTALGWGRKEEIVSISDILRVTQAIRDATKLTTDSKTGLSRRGMSQN